MMEYNHHMFGSNGANIQDKTRFGNSNNPNYT